MLRPHNLIQVVVVVLAIGCSSTTEPANDPTVSVEINYLDLDMRSTTYRAVRSDSAFVQWSGDSISIAKGKIGSRSYAKGTTITARYAVYVSTWEGYAWADTVLHRAVYFTANSNSILVF